MAFPVTFWRFAKEVNSTALPNDNIGHSLQCVVNSGIDIVSPTISLNCGIGGVADSPINYNYCKIPIFGNRYYFIETWKWEDGKWNAYCRVDVLATYRTEIGNMQAYVLRSAHSYDETISDEMYPAKEEFGHIEVTSTNSPWIGSITLGTIIVGIAGSGSTQYYGFTYNNFVSFITALLSDAYVTTVVGAWGFQVDSETKSIVDPLQYITSVVFIPLEPPLSSSAMTLNVGFGHVNATCFSLGLAGFVTTEHYNVANIPEHPYSAPEIFGEYMNHSPWLNLTLDAPPFGIIELDTDKITNREIELAVSVDWPTGDAVLRVYSTRLSGSTVVTDTLMNLIKGRIGINIEIGQVVARGMGTLTMIQTGANIVSQTMGGITGGGGSGAMMGNITGFGRNPLMAIGSAIGGIASATSGISGAIKNAIENKIPSINTVGSLGSFADIASGATVYAQWAFPVESSRETRGRPLCKNKTLSTLGASVPDSLGIYHSGFLLIADPDVKNFAATAMERDAITSFLTGGFYYA